MNAYTGTIVTRIRFLLILAMFLVGILIWRMCNLQIAQHNYYLGLAFGQQRFDKAQMAQRGKLLVHDSMSEDSVYYPLAFDVKTYAIWVVPKNVKNKDNVATILADSTGISKDEIFGKINNDKLYIPPIKRGLKYDEANVISDKKISGVFVMPEYSRYFPEGSLASQDLGFVNSTGDGKYGLEGYYNSELKGKDGSIQGEQDTLGRVINLLQQNDPQDGVSYVLTLDRSVQYYVEKKLKEAIEKYQAESGTVVVMDIQTGGIVAMANSPDFDPNNYRDQAQNDQSLFANPAISSVFEPGSIFKTITMAAAIDQGVVTPETEGVFDATVKVGNHTISTAEGKAFGKETMTQVLQNSDNVAMVWLSEKMGNDMMYKYLKSFGFLDKTGIDLDTESNSIVQPLKQWKDITRATLSFGQGVSVTPIQMVAAYAAIANNGKYIYPHIVDKIIMPDGTEKKIEKKEGEQVLKESVAAQVRDMLRSVVELGHSKLAAVPGFNVGAKTGTAQIPNPDGTGYEDSPDKLGIYNHSLAGFAPTDKPRYALLVKLTKPKTAKYAESTAAPFSFKLLLSRETNKTDQLTMQYFL